MAIYIGGEEVGVVINTEQKNEGEFWVKVIDYDGTILKEDWLDTGDTFTLPKPPTHDRLTFQEWASPVEIIDGAITVGRSDITIGATYITKSGNHEFNIELNDRTGLYISFTLSPSSTSATNTITFYWGDGTSNSYDISSSSTITCSHTYSSAGQYMLQVEETNILDNDFCWTISTFLRNEAGDNIKYCLKNARFGNWHFNQDSTSVLTFLNVSYCLETVTLPFYANKPMKHLSTNAFFNAYNLKPLVLPRGIQTIQPGALSSLVNLKNISIPYTVTSTASNILSGCNNLQSISLPNGLVASQSLLTSASYLKSLYLQDNQTTILGANTAQNSYSLEKVKLSTNTISLGLQAFYMCYSLKDINLSDCTSLTSIGSSAFRSCYKLKDIVLPDSLTDLDPTAFEGCYNLSLKNYDNANYLPATSNPYIALMSRTNSDITSCTIHENCKQGGYNEFTNKTKRTQKNRKHNTRRTCKKNQYKPIYLQTIRNK